MEKSIEHIWKNGFTNDLSFTPKVTDFEGFQSIYFVDQFKKRYQNNVIILILTAVIVLFAFIMGGIPVIGLAMFSLFASLAILGKRELGKLDTLNIGDSNYEYIKAFDGWLKNLIDRFSLIYRVLIPLLFLGFTLAILHTNLFIPFLGETLLEKFVGDSHTFLIFGLPVWMILGLLLSAWVLSYFSDFIFKREMKSIYGDLISKLNRLLQDLDELR